MNLLEDIAGIFEPEQERLRRIHALGDRLPWKPKPQWVIQARPTPLGFYRLPLAHATEGHLQSLAQPGFIVIMLLIGGLFLWVLGLELSHGRAADSLLTSLGAVCFLGMAIAGLIDYVTRHRFGPETASLQVRPGDSFLLLLRPRPGAPAPLRAELIYRERWYIDAGKQSYWKEEELRSLPLKFAPSTGGLLSAHVTLPADLPASYDAGRYRLEWAVAIESFLWLGITRTRHYLLWVGDA